LLAATDSVKKSKAYLFLITANLFVFAGLWSFLPQEMPFSYFEFADNRNFLGIPNFADVMSNLAFALIGFQGLSKLNSWSKKDPLFTHLLVFLVGVSLVSVGSAYFHWNPNPDTLIWDRIPMAVSFMSLITLLIADRIDNRYTKAMLLPLVILGILTVINVDHWGSDLRPYTVTQFGTLLTAFLIILFFKPTKISQKSLILLFGFYVLAKIFEITDGPVFEALHFISGHTLKHLSAATGLYFFVREI
jgi:hypothetical protein